jgi:hypothetical protein
MNASDAATEFHERTKHTWQRLRANARGLDWGNHPFPFKLYPVDAHVILRGCAHVIPQGVALG